MMNALTIPNLSRIFMVLQNTVKPEVKLPGAELNEQRIYRYTSIGRPLDPAFPSNRVVLIILPLVAVLGAVMAWLSGGQGLFLLENAIIFALVALGCWALAREVFPDDSPAAFISMALGVVAAVAIDELSVLTLFATLGLVRMVNRSTGLTALKTDSIMVMLLVFAVIYTTSSPFFGAVAALAFILDGTLKDPSRRQWLFGLICLGGMVVYMVDHDVGFSYFRAPNTLFEWLSVAALLVLALDTILLKEVHTHADTVEQSLDLARVKGGMAVALLAALQGLAVIENVALVVMSVAGIGIGMAFRKAFQAPAVG